MTEEQKSFQRLNEIVFELREKCPWDRKQTKESLRHLTIEETYELADAILKGDYEEIKVELGDLMLHLLFYASLAQDKGKFNIHEVLESQIEKLIRRHPHVYGDMVGASEEQIKKNWEAIKAQERAESGKEHFQSVLDGVPDSMPSLIKAHRMQEKAAQMGFDWTDIDQVMDKVREELEEFAKAESPAERADEMGDILFSLVNYCRHAGINAEDALAQTNQKFKDRFQFMEKKVKASELHLPDLSLEEMDKFWEEAKKALKA
ncbi:MAG: nucleoside triphosphate pyrophosphohydrolase [Bacteroidota bacterium]